MEQDSSTGWACIDCLMLLANGETPPEMNEEETAEYLARVEAHCAGTEVTLGLLYEDDNCSCSEEDKANQDYERHSQCEQIEFSWSQCDVCGSHLGGSREAVTFWFPTTIELRKNES